MLLAFFSLFVILLIWINICTICTHICIAIGKASHYFPSQYFPLVLTSQSEIQWAENNFASSQFWLWSRWGSVLYSLRRTLFFFFHLPMHQAVQRNVTCTSNNDEFWFIIIVLILSINDWVCSRSLHNITKIAENRSNIFSTFSLLLDPFIVKWDASKIVFFCLLFFSHSHSHTYSIWFNKYSTAFAQEKKCWC